MVTKSNEIFRCGHRYFEFTLFFIHNQYFIVKKTLIPEGVVEISQKFLFTTIASRNTVDVGDGKPISV
jgi:hypothetical protein